MLTCRRLLRSLQEQVLSLLMSTQVVQSILILLVAVGCTTTRQPDTPGLPGPVVPQPSGPMSDNSGWSFAYRSDTIRIRVNRSAAIESTSDSGSHREISTNNTIETLALAVNADTIRYTATVDSFSTASQGLIGTVQAVNLPIQISGVIDSLLTADSSAQSCDPVQANLEGDVRNVLVSFPRRLATGQSWRDSAAHTACYGRIPMVTMTVRIFSVIGQTSFNGQSAVAIQRIDSIRARGEGRQQQHLLGVEVRGTGGATYTLSTELGRLLHLTVSQELGLSVRAAGRTKLFHESVKEEFNPSP